MSFSRICGIWTLIGLTGMMGLSVGCGSRNPPSTLEATSLGIEDNEIGCLSRAGEIIGRYLDGKAGPDEVPQLKNCAVKALQVFAKRTKGAQEDRYSAEELGSFLERYFLENTKLSPAFLAQAMKIKRVLLGGAENAITRDELERASVFLAEISHQLVKLQPFMPWDIGAFVKFPVGKFELLRRTLSDVGFELGSFLKASGQAWKFDEIPDLLKSLTSLSPDIAGDALADEVQKKLPVIQKLKRICLGPNGEGIEAGEWPGFLSTLGQWYSLWIKILYTQERDPFFDQFNRYAITDSWMATFEEALGLVEQSLARQPNESVPLGDLISAIDDLQDEFKGSSIRAVFEQTWNLKVQLAGGDPAALIRADMVTLKTWAKFAQTLMPRLGQLDPFIFEAYENLPPEKFKRVEESFLAVGRDLADFIKSAPGSVSASQIVSLMKLWSRYFEMPLSKNVADFEANFDFFKRFKRTLIGFMPDRIQAGEWEYSVRRATEWYVLYLKALYWQKQDPLASSLADYRISPEWVGLMEKGLAYLSDSTAFHPLATLHRDEVENLLEALVDSHSLAQTKRFFSDALLLKRALMGGESQALVPADYTKMTEFVRFAAKHIPKLREVLPLTFESTANLSFSEMERRSRKLAELAASLGAFVENYGTSYSWKEAISLLESAGQYMDIASQEWLDMIQIIEKNLPLIRSTKFMFMASNGDGVSANEWREFLELIAKGYGLLLKADYFAKKKGEFDHSPGLLWFQSIGDELIAELDSAVKRHRNQTLLFEALDSVLTEAFPKTVPVTATDEVKTASVQTLIRDLFRGMLAGTDTGPTGRKAQGITPAHIARLRFSWQRWIEGQHFIELLYQKVGSVKRSYPAEKLLSHSIESVYGLPDTQLSEATLDAARFVRWILKDGGRKRLHQPLYQRPEGRMYFPEGQWQEEISYFDLTQSLWLHELMRVLARGYTERNLGQNLPFYDINFEEATHFYADISDISAQLHLTDPSIKTVVSNRFIEANLFVYSANGDDAIDQAEGVELFAFLISGKDQSGFVHEEVFKKCPKTGLLDFYLKPKVSVPCYRQEFYGNFEKYMSNAPAMVRFFRGLSEKEQGKFIRAYEVGARKFPDDPLMLSDDTDGFTTLAQYAEALYVRIDRNRDGLVDWPEAEAAYPQFKKILADFAETSNDTWLRPAFYYMLKYGEQPSTSELIWWKTTMNLHAMDSDRGKLMGIIAEISSANAESAKRMKSVKEAQSQEQIRSTKLR